MPSSKGLEVAIDPRFHGILKSGVQSQMLLALKLSKKRTLRLGELASVCDITPRQMDHTGRDLLHAEIVERDKVRGEESQYRVASIDVSGPPSGSCDGMHPKRRKAKSLSTDDVEDITGAQ